jgi:hypothetical protein
LSIHETAPGSTRRAVSCVWAIITRPYAQPAVSYIRSKWTAAV